MKRFLIASAALTLLALPPVLQATGTAATNPYVARYSLDYYRNDPVPLTALEIRRIEKAAALYARTGTITILPARVAPKAPAPVVSAPRPAPTAFRPVRLRLAAAYVAPAPAAIIGPTDLELRRQAKADLLFKRTGIRTVLPARTCGSGGSARRRAGRSRWRPLRRSAGAGRAVAQLGRAAGGVDPVGVAAQGAGGPRRRRDAGRARARHAGPARSRPARPRPLAQEIREDRSLIFRPRGRRLSEAASWLRQAAFSRPDPRFRCPLKLRLFSQVPGACGRTVPAAVRGALPLRSRIPSQVQAFPEKMQNSMGTRNVKRSFDGLATDAAR